MLGRDAHATPLNRQAVVVVTGVGVGLLTLAFVLGVQVGKQTAALHASRPLASAENLTRLPEPLHDQLRHFETSEPRPKPEPRKPEPPSPPPSPRPTPEPRWTLQLLATTDAPEAKRTAERAKAAGFPSVVLVQQKQHKVRLQREGTRTDAERWAAQLRAKGFKPFPVKVD